MKLIPIIVVDCWYRGLALLFVCLAISGCFSSPDDSRLDGERIDILELGDVEFETAKSEDVNIRLAVPSLATQWINPSQTPGHVSGHHVLADDASLVWRRSLGKGEGRAARLTASPIVFDGIVYALDARVQVTALRLDNGEVIWSTNLVPDDDVRGHYGGGLTYANGKLYVPAGDGRLHILNPVDGTLEQSILMRAPARAAPLIVGDVIFVQTIDNALTAYDMTTWQDLWVFEGEETPLGLTGSSAPAWQDGTVFAAFNDGELVAINASTGRLAWSQSMDVLGALGRGVSNVAALRAQPVVDGNTVMASSFGGSTAHLEYRNGQAVWEVRAGAVSTPILTDRHVFFITPWGEMLALTRAEGALVWRKDLPGAVNRKDIIKNTYYGPVLANGQLVAASSNRRLVFVDAITGELVRNLRLRARAAAVDPMVVDGTLLVVTRDGYINAFR